MKSVFHYRQAASSVEDVDRKNHSAFDVYDQRGKNKKPLCLQRMSARMPTKMYLSRLVKQLPILKSHGKEDCRSNGDIFSIFSHPAGPSGPCRVSLAMRTGSEDEGKILLYDYRA